MPLHMFKVTHDLQPARCLHCGCNDTDAEANDPCPRRKVSPPNSAHNGYSTRTTAEAILSAIGLEHVVEPMPAIAKPGEPRSPREANTARELVAIKIYEPQHRGVRDHERGILQRLMPHRHVPVVVDSLELEQGPALFLRPVGNPVSPVKFGLCTNRPDYFNVLDALQHAHGLGICHRDVRPQNIYIDLDGGVFLSGWSSAAPTGQLTTNVAGAEYYYAKRDEPYAASPADDLVAFVRSVALMYTNQNPSKKTAKWMNESSLWQSGLQPASLCDYEGVRRHLRYI